MARRSNNDGKYLRLTGLWPSKNNDDLYTGRSKEEQNELLKEKLKEALANDSALVWSLWVNSNKKGKRDPEYTLQVFVSEGDEKPRERDRDRNEDDEERPRKRNKREEEEEEEVEDKPKKNGKKPSKKNDDDSW